MPWNPISEELQLKLIAEYHKSNSIKVAATECKIHRNTAGKYLKEIRKRLPPKKVIIEKYNELKNIMATAKFFNIHRNNITYALKTYRKDL